MDDNGLLLNIQNGAEQALAEAKEQGFDPASGPLVVVTLDTRSGDIQAEVLPDDDFVLVLGEKCNLDGMQVYGNGTQVLTIKKGRRRS